MNTLYPPQIEGTIPAFCQGQVLTVPFAMNQAVGWEEIDGFAIKIKNIQNNELVAMLTTLKIEQNNEIVSTYNKNEYCAYFEANWEEKNFVIGNFYKVQLCYIKANKDENNKIINIEPKEYGIYSTVGIIKYTTLPEVTIKGLDKKELNNDIRKYIGSYSQEGKDSSEKIYSYNFTIYDENGAVIETSEELLHNHEDDNKSYETFDEYVITAALEENTVCSIVYTIKTINGLEVSSPRYRITNQSTIPPVIKVKLIANMNQENGYVDLQLFGEKDELGNEKVGNGTFLICRSSSEDGYTTWQELDRFTLFGQPPSNHNWKDFTVQHGFSYIYSLQQYNRYGIYSERLLSNEITAIFEHSFLYDGKRQLKIKYNPKVTSFKETLLEQKTNTLGGKYPFFFRNGNVRYKEFPISGLISYQSDEEELFLTNKELFLEDVSGLKREFTLKPYIKANNDEYFINNISDAFTGYNLQSAYRARDLANSQENRIANKKDRTTNLTDYNIVAERIFKTKVLEFLNDGKPKLFRSPGEGNFIVRLMNSSLTPEDKLNRMLHSFSTTATEIDDYNFEKLNKYSLISIDSPDIKLLKWKTIKFSDYNKNKTQGFKLISIGEENNIYSIQCVDMKTGDKIYITFPGDKEPRMIQIGATGEYFAEFDEPPVSIKFSSLSKEGQITYSFYEDNISLFDSYAKIKMADIPLLQLKGDTKGQDIREYFQLEDCKYKITNYYILNFTKDDTMYSCRDAITALKEAEQNWLDLVKDLNPMKDFYDKIKIQEEYYNYLEKIEEIKKNFNNKKYDSKNLYKFWLDGKEIDISDTNEFQLINPNYIPEIILGDGVCLDISIQRREIIYDIELENNIAFIISKTLYEKQKTIYQNIQHYYQSDKPLADTYVNQGILEINDDNDLIYEGLPLDATYKRELVIRRNYMLSSYSTFIKQLESELKKKEV